MALSLPVPSLDTSLSEYVTLLKTTTDKAVKTATELPRDIPFHRTLDRKFRTELDATSARVLRLTNRLLKLAETLDIKSRPVSGKAKGHEDGEEVALVDEEDVVDKFHSVVVDVFDPLLEHVDHCLDIHAGRVKPVREVIPVVREKDVLREMYRSPPDYLNIFYMLPIYQNRNFSSWIKLITRTHFNGGTTPRNCGIQNGGPDQMEVTSTTGILSRSHPYQHEIATLQYPQSMFTSRAPIAPKSFEEVSFTYIDTKEGLFSLLDKLRLSDEIAIDLEHHSYHSYYGFVCLMQISTRSEDFVVDCLVPDIRQNLEALNEVFTDPAKVKVLHGAESDIVWLQENFNLYIVNLFDTFHASRALDLPRHSLAFLLSVYCDFTADKRYQLADWRIRPLPSEMLHYARSDTHFLLFVYDRLREALIERSNIPGPSDSALVDGNEAIPLSIQTVLKNSAETSLREFIRENYDAEKGEGMRGWAGLARKWNKRSLFVDGPQRRIFLAVHKWRDEVARDEDESAVSVISNQALLTLIEKPVPTNLIALYSSFPGAVPPLVRKRGNELVQLMQDAASKATVVEVAPDIPMDVEAQQLPISADVPRHILFSTQAIPVRDLWIPSVPSQMASVTMAASRSSLFGSKSSASLSQKSAASSTTAKLLTRNSSLLGPGTGTVSSKRPVPVPSLSGAMDTDKVQQAIARIHEGILKSDKKIVTVQIQAIKATNAVSEASTSMAKLEQAKVEPTEATPPTSAPIPEVAFVHRDQRTTTQIGTDDIVQVGQRKKKRKRADDADVDPARRTKKKAGQSEHKETTPELQVFDYSAGPNILDEGMKDVDETKGGRKGKHGRKDASKEKGTRLDFKSLGFGPTPKQSNEPKSGNKSMTFR